MSKYRKKPIVIEAEQFFRQMDTIPICVEYSYKSGEFFINTLEGIMEVRDGDWIITGIAGEKYPCKDSIFKLTYDLVEEL